MNKGSIQSVLFCCDYNSVRSPMAEGILKKLVGNKIFVQSAGIFDTRGIDGFTVRVCHEINVKLNQHRVRSLSEVEKNGGFVGSFDLVVAFTLRSLEEAKKYSIFSSVEIESWMVKEPQNDERNVNLTLDHYRETREIIFNKISLRFKEYLV